MDGNKIVKQIIPQQTDMYAELSTRLEKRLINPATKHACLFSFSFHSVLIRVSFGFDLLQLIFDRKTMQQEWIVENEP